MTWLSSQKELGVEATPNPRGLWRFTTKSSGSLVAPQKQDRRLGGQRRASVPRSFEAGNTQHDRGACVGRTRRPDGCAAIRWKISCVDQNAPVRACVVTPSIGALQSFFGGPIYRRSG
jgi:hypothetical protein